MQHKTSLECAVEAAARLDNILAVKGKIKTPQGNNLGKHPEIFSAEYVINDYPSNVREYLTKIITQEEISNFSGTKITSKGCFVPPEELHSQEANTGSKNPLFLLIQGPNKQSLDLAIQRINEVANGLSNPNQNNPNLMMSSASSNMTSQPPPPPQFINVVQNMQGVEKVLVGLDHAPLSFDIRNKVLGPNGANLQYIMSETGATVTLRGKGSGYIEMHSGQESLEPLHICVEHNNKDVLQNARQLAFNLIETLQRELQQFCQQQPPPNQQTQHIQQLQVTQAYDQIGNVITLQQQPGGDHLPQGMQMSTTSIQVPIITTPYTQTGLGQIISVPPPSLGIPPPQIIQTQTNQPPPPGPHQVTSLPPPTLHIPQHGGLPLQSNQQQSPQYIQHQQITGHNMQTHQIITSQPPPMINQQVPPSNQSNLIQTIAPQSTSISNGVLPQGTQYVQTAYPTTVQYIQTANGQIVALPSSTQPGQQLILNQIPSNIIQQGQLQGQGQMQPGTVTLVQGQQGQILLGQNQAVHLAQLQNIQNQPQGQVMFVQYQQPAPQNIQMSTLTQQPPPPQHLIQQAPPQSQLRGAPIPPQPVPDPNDGTNQQQNIQPPNCNSNTNTTDISKLETKIELKQEKDGSETIPSQQSSRHNMRNSNQQQQLHNMQPPTPSSGSTTQRAPPKQPPTPNTNKSQSPHGQKRTYEESIGYQVQSRPMNPQGIGNLAIDGKPVVSRSSVRTTNEKNNVVVDNQQGDWNNPQQQQNQQQQQQQLQSNGMTPQQNGLISRQTLGGPPNGSIITQQQMAGVNMQGGQLRGNPSVMVMHDMSKPEAKRMRGPPPPQGANFDPNMGGVGNGGMTRPNAPPTTSNDRPTFNHYSSKPQMYNAALPFHLQGLVAPPPPPPPPVGENQYYQQQAPPNQGQQYQQVLPPGQGQPQQYQLQQQLTQGPPPPPPPSQNQFYTQQPPMQQHQMNNMVPFQQQQQQQQYNQQQQQQIQQQQQQQYNHWMLGQHQQTMNQQQQTHQPQQQ